MVKSLVTSKYFEGTKKKSLITPILMCSAGRGQP